MAAGGGGGAAARAAQVAAGGCELSDFADVLDEFLTEHRAAEALEAEGLKPLQVCVGEVGDMAGPAAVWLCGYVGEDAGGRDHCSRAGLWRTNGQHNSACQLGRGAGDAKVPPNPDRVQPRLPPSSDCRIYCSPLLASFHPMVILHSSSLPPPPLPTPSCT